MARAPVQALPLHHAPLFQENTIYVNLRGAVVDYTQKERDSFLKDDLGKRTEDVLDIFLDPSTLQLHLTLATPALFAEILGRLFASVQWTAVGNFLVHGWAAAEPLVSVHVTGVPRRFSTSLLKRHFETFGPVSKIIRLPDRTWSSAASGVIQLLVQLRPGMDLPHFVNVVDPQGLLCERFAVYTEGRHRRCFRCSGTGRIGPFCKASCLAPEADSSLWSSMVYNGPVLATPTAVGPSPSAAAAPAAPSTVADDAALSTTPAAGRWLLPSPSRSGSPSSASDMSGAEDDGSETDGFHKPRRRRKRSPQTGSPGSMSPN